MIDAVANTTACGGGGGGVTGAMLGNSVGCGPAGVGLADGNGSGVGLASGPTIVMAGPDDETGVMPGCAGDAAPTTITAAKAPQAKSGRRGT